MRFPSDTRRRFGAVALLLLPPFLLLLLATVLSPTEDTHWRKIEINDGTEDSYLSQGLFEFVTLKGDEELKSDMNLGDGDGDWCGDKYKASFGDECCEPFRTTQSLAISATSLSFVSFALLAFSSIYTRGRISRKHTNAAGVLSFAAGVLGISLVIVYDDSFDEMFCGEEKMVGGIDVMKQSYKELEYGPLFFLAVTGSILSVLAGTVLFFIHDGEAFTKRDVGTSRTAQSRGRGRTEDTSFTARVGAQVPEKSGAFPGTLVF